MKIEKVWVDGNEYRLFTEVVLFPNTDKEVECGPIAEEALDIKINEYIEKERYSRVQNIDEMYGYYVPQEIADREDEDEIRESIEDVWE